MSETDTGTAQTEAPETAAKCKEQVCACGKIHEGELDLEQTQAAAEAARALAADMAAGMMPSGNESSDRIYEVLFGHGAEGMYWACIAWSSMLLAVGYRPEREEGKPPPFLIDSASQPESFGPEDIRYQGAEWAGRLYNAFVMDTGPEATVRIFNELGGLKSGLERSEYVWPLLATTALQLQKHLHQHDPLAALASMIKHAVTGEARGKRSREVQLNIVSINVGDPGELLRTMLGAEEQEETSDATDSTDQNVPGPDHADRPSEPGDRGPGEESESPARP